jgi:ligand-binding sensor protein
MSKNTSVLQMQTLLARLTTEQAREILHIAKRQRRLRTCNIIQICRVSRHVPNLRKRCSRSANIVGFEHSIQDKSNIPQPTSHERT